MRTEDRKLRMALFGVTGVAGGGVAEAWLGDARVAELRAIARRPPALTAERLRVILCEDFLGLDAIGDALAGVDALCFCLGISVSQVDSEDQYRLITHDYALAAARALRAASPEATFHFLSGAGTNPSSRMMWARVKGETEEELKTLDLGGVVCWRPAMILADRAPRGLPWSYRAAYPVMRLLRFVPSLSIRAVDLGRAMLQATLSDRRDGTLDNRQIRAEAKRYASGQPE